MNVRVAFCVCVFLCHNNFFFAADKNLSASKNPFTFDFSGDLTFEGYIDSRQVAGYSQDVYTFYPLPIKFDKRGLDINARSQHNMLGVNTTCRVDVTGPDVWHAASSAVVEGDFLGLNDGTIRLIRLLKAYARLDWKRTILSVGFKTHPMTLAFYGMYPHTVSGNEGTGFDPFVYAPVFEVRYRRGDCEVVAAISKSYDTETFRWAVIPDLFLQLNAHIRNHIFGVGMNYHVEVPRIRTDTGFKTTEQLGAIASFIFAFFRPNHMDIKCKCIYLQNAAPFGILGAYGVKWRDEQTDERFYTSMRTLCVWTDLIYYGKRLEPGLFVGLARNIGASTPIMKSYKNTAGKEVSLLDVKDALTHAKYLFICAPRLRWRIGRFLLGFEIEYTRGSFARGYDEENWQNDFDDFGKVVRSRTVSNTRLFGITKYEF